MSPIFQASMTMIHLQSFWQTFSFSLKSCSIKILKSKAIALQAWTGPEGSRRWRLTEFLTIGIWKWKVKLSALCTCHLYPPGNIPITHCSYRLSEPQGHSAAGRIMSMKNSNDIIENWARDLPACSVEPQPTAFPRAPYKNVINIYKV